MTTREAWPPPDVMTRIAADFPNEAPATILALLEQYEGVEKSRVARCILHLAGGSADQLHRFIGNAKTDYRDVIYWAEYGQDDQRIHDFNQPFAVTAAVPRDASLSFIGGRPLLSRSAEIPTCAICSARMCFYFQVALPVGHRWQHTVISMFHCVSCCSEDTLIPEMLNSPLNGADIPQGFLTRYQTNFRIVTSDATTAEVRNDYHPPIPNIPISPSLWRIGAVPQWLLDDETPGSHASFKEPIFLFQVPHGMTFPRLPDAPAQMTLDLAGEVVAAERDYYELFVGNAAYFFGFGAPAAERVYVVTQDA
jgi:hypothetical protein